MENYQTRLYPEIKVERIDESPSLTGGLWTSDGFVRRKRQFSLRVWPLVHKTLQEMCHTQEYTEQKLVLMAY